MGSASSFTYRRDYPLEDFKDHLGDTFLSMLGPEAHDLLKTLRDKIGEHPEIGQAIHKLATALATLEVQTGGML